MEQYKEAVRAVSEPSRAQELKRELRQATLEDLQLRLKRAQNNGQKKRIRKQIAAALHK